MNDFKNILQNLFSKTGDSELKQYLYSHGKISLTAELYDDDVLQMEFETEILYCKSFELKTPFNVGYFECIKLSDVLKVENNHYSFSGNFVDLMKAQKSKFSLAFGLSVQHYTHLITFLNTSISLAFIVNEKNDYKVLI